MLRALAPTSVKATIPQAGEARSIEDVGAAVTFEAADNPACSGMAGAAEGELRKQKVMPVHAAMPTARSVAAERGDRERLSICLFKRRSISSREEACATQSVAYHV